MSILAQLDLSAKKQSKLNSQLFQQFRSFIYEKTGIYFQDNKQYLLESRVGQRLRKLGMQDYEAYFKYVRNGGVFKELPLLVNSITINETFFFRNTSQFDVIEQEIIPQIIQQRSKEGRPRVRIWSAACSTGDEPHTLAIIIKERLLPRYPHIQFEILGSDINTQVLEIARAGVYGQYAVRNIPPLFLGKYFRSEGDKYTLSADVRNLVSFQKVNLTDRGAMARLRAFDIILCANVLIYFDTKSKQQVVASLYNSLNGGGHLLIGFSETLYGVTQVFQPVRFTKTIAYKKG